MHNIDRIKEPYILRNNKEKWTQELLLEIDKTGSYGKVDESFKMRYKHKEVSNFLSKMNRGYCFYCEQKIGKTDYPHIEHFRPKNQFPELSFDWKNLHLSCSKCNIKKGKKWNGISPILDPCNVDTDICKHISYSLWELKPESENAISSIDTFFLNDNTKREELVTARKKVFMELMIVIGEVNNANNVVEKRKKVDVLKKHTSNYEFKGMIENTVNTFLKED